MEVCATLPRPALVQEMRRRHDLIAPTVQGLRRSLLVLTARTSEPSRCTGRARSVTDGPGLAAATTGY